MDKETWSFFHNAFCSRLRTIKSEMEAHGGVFKDGAMIDDSLDCVRGIKNLLKVKALEDKSSTATASAIPLR